jgi:hypothetical protein
MIIFLINLFQDMNAAMPRAFAQPDKFFNRLGFSPFEGIFIMLILPKITIVTMICQPEPACLILT